MAFADFPDQELSVKLLQRSLERGRLGHAYLFAGNHLDALEALARTLAKTLNCERPVRAGEAAVDCCDKCSSCQRIEAQSHGDIQWVRPESKSRIISVDQMREVMREVQLKPNEAAFKVAVIVAADRLNVQAANAFLKTLEEPPTRSVLILLSIEPQRLLETILSRCLRLNFAGEGRARFDAAQVEWLGKFSSLAAGEQKSLLGRYRLMDLLLQKLAAVREQVETALAEQSPLEQFPEAEKDLREKWEDELKAATEAEYRRQRSELLLSVQWWLRDVWLETLGSGGGLLNFPEISDTHTVSRRLSPDRAAANLRVIEQTQWLLHSNVQEGLALEVSLLKLQF